MRYERKGGEETCCEHVYGSENTSHEQLINYDCYELLRIAHVPEFKTNEHNKQHQHQHL